MTCRRCQERLSQHLDGELGPRTARAVERHLADCAACASVHEELSILGAWIGTLPSLAPAEARAGGGREREAGAVLGTARSTETAIGAAAEPGDALWSCIEAELDADATRPVRRAPPWHVMVPALAAASLAAAVATAEGLRAMGARRVDRVIDAQLRAESAGAYGRTAMRHRGLEQELRGMAGEPVASPQPLEARWLSAAEPPEGLERALAAERERVRSLLERADAAYLPGLPDAPGPSGAWSSVIEPLAAGSAAELASYRVRGAGGVR